jgi:hypothetical protein
MKYPSDKESTSGKYNNKICVRVRKMSYCTEIGNVSGQFSNVTDLHSVTLTNENERHRQLAQISECKSNERQRDSKRKTKEMYINGCLDSGYH